MATYSVEIHGTVEVPGGVKEIKAYDGRVVGFELADGKLLKPWIVFELQDADEMNSRDLNSKELNDLGFDIEYDERVLERLEEKEVGNV